MQDCLEPDIYLSVLYRWKKFFHTSLEFLKSLLLKLKGLPFQYRNRQIPLPDAMVNENLLKSFLSEIHVLYEFGVEQRILMYHLCCNQACDDFVLNLDFPLRIHQKYVDHNFILRLPDHLPFSAP